MDKEMLVFPNLLKKLKLLFQMLDPLMFRNRYLIPKWCEMKFESFSLNILNNLLILFEIFGLTNQS